MSADPLLVDNLINPALAEKLCRLREKFNQQYNGVPETERDESESILDIPVPIERVLFSSTNLSSVSFIGQDGQSSIVADALATSLGDYTVATASRDTVIVTSGTSNTVIFNTNSNVHAVALLSPSRVLVFTNKIELFDNGLRVCDHDLKKIVKEALVVSPSQIVVSTNIGEVYILTLSLGKSNTPTITHQLMIAANASSLGSIHAIRFCSQRLLAVVGSAAVLILDLTVVDKPKLLFKKTSAMQGNKVWAVWLLDILTNQPRLVVNGQYSLSRTCEGSPFMSEPLLTNRAMSGLAVAVSDSVFLFQPSTDVSQMYLCQIDSSGKRLMMVEKPHVMSSQCPTVIAPSRWDINMPVVSFFVVSVRPTAVDVHKGDLMKWLEYVLSLLHGEKFSLAINLLLSLKKGSLPLLLDDSETLLSDSTLITGLVSKYLKSKSSLTINEMDQIVTIGAILGMMEEVSDTITKGHKGQFFKSLLTKVVNNTIPVTCLTQDVVMKTIAHSAVTDTDVFISAIIVKSKDEILIDTNQIVRLATAHDLASSVVLVHAHLLHDYMYPIKYWLSKGQSFDLIVYYMYCLSRNLRFPLMDQQLSYPSSICQSLIKEERSSFEKIILTDPQAVLDCIGWDLWEDLQSYSAHYLDLKDHMLVYEIKAAIAHDIISHLLTKVSINDCIDLLVKQGEMGIVLIIIDRANSRISQRHLMSIFTQLLTINDDQVVRFALKFDLPMDDCVNSAIKGGRIDTAVKLLAKTKHVDRAISLIREQMNSDEKTRLAVWITDRFAAKTNDPHKFNELWQSMDFSLLITNTNVARCLSVSGIDLIMLATSIPDISAKAWVMKLYKNNLELLAQASLVSALDVGTQFAILAKTDCARSKGIPVTASICHACLDPVTATSKATSRRADLMLFSCGHIVHRSCGDQTGCPVCV